MNKFFYHKLALSNLKKNRGIYIPFLISSIITCAIFYAFLAIVYDKAILSMPGAMALVSMLGFGSVVVGLFAVVFLFYTNSFLIKKRKKELGLYSILGMEKKHIARLMLYESIYIALFSIGVGLVTGILFSRLVYFLLFTLTHLSGQFEVPISFEAIVTTVTLFAIIFGLTLISNLWQTQLAKPIELLKGGQTGEKEPKGNILIALIGLVTTGIGYYLAATVVNPLDALFTFFIAVILVIIGTYCLFTATSIFILKLLRKNKKFYYKSNNFIATSGMIYRMKQNAVGLANICILSCMVLVTVSTTASLYLGAEESITAQYPQQVEISGSFTEEEATSIESSIRSVGKDNGIELDFFEYYRYRSIFGYFGNGELITQYSEEVKNNPYAMIQMIPLDDFNRLLHVNYQLEDGQILLYDEGNNIDQDFLLIDGRNFSIKEEIKEYPYASQLEKYLAETFLVVVKDVTVMNSFSINEPTEEPITVNYIFGMDLVDSTQEEQYRDLLLVSLRDSEISSFRITSQNEMRESFYNIYGGFLFLGCFLGILFLMATTMIIYYKQISEGYDDHDRYEIMQKVGMSRKEVRKAINKQILMVFYLPLVVAIIHICFAFNMVRRLLMLFSLTNIQLFIIVTVGTVIIFSILYGIVYTITARKYYKIVQA